MPRYREGGEAPRMEAENRLRARSCENYSVFSEKENMDGVKSDSVKPVKT